MKKIRKNKFILLLDVLRASFISLIPYYIFYSILILIVSLLKYYEIEHEYITRITALVDGMFPILINLSISYHLSIIYQININRIIFIILGLLIFLSVELLLHNGQLRLELLSHTPLLILIPVSLYFFFNIYILLTQKYYRLLEVRLSKSISSSFINIIPFFLSFLILTPIFYYLANNLNFNFENIDYFHTEWILFLRMILSHLLWFLGIHGSNFLETIISLDILNSNLLVNLKAKEFYDLFIILGGSGCGLSLVIAIFLASKDKHITSMGKISLPFVIFNIDEILIFGIPIFLNFSLVIPFLLVPIVNFILGYIGIVYLELFSFNSLELPWITPALINIYLKTDGNIFALLFQVLLVILGTLIYMPFLKKYSLTQSSTYNLDKMIEKLDLSSEVESKTDIKFREAQTSLVNFHYKVYQLIELINRNDLFIYYQPKIDIKENKCIYFEALIRYKALDNTIKGPDFIEDIEDSGFAFILDIWVCKEVKKALDKWAEIGFHPLISINIFPHTLEEREYVERIIEIMGEYNITIEITERRSSLKKNIIDNLVYLKNNGFIISLDDVGTGYTNFAVLYELPLDEVKIDKSIIDLIESKKGLVFYENICELCSCLNYDIVLEGVETKEQIEKLKNSNVKHIQGWYYSKAISFDEVHTFAKEFNKDETMV